MFLMININIFVKTKTHWNVMCIIKIYKNHYFCCLGFCKRKFYNIWNFSLQCCLRSDTIFSYPGVLKLVSHILKSLFYQNLLKIRSSDKRQSLTGVTFQSCLVITDTKFTTKVECLSIFLKIWISNVIFFSMKNKNLIHINNESIISSKIVIPLSFQMYSTYRHSQFFFILSAKRSEITN